MTRLLTLVLALAVGASAQVSPDSLVGEWTVDRYTFAQPDTSDVLLPALPLFVCTAARFEPDGQALATIVGGDRQGYALEVIPMTNTLDGDRLTLIVDDMTLRLAVALDGDALRASNAQGTFHLRRDR